QAFLGIQIRPHARDTANDFVQKALALPETLALYNVSGSDDYLVHVAVANSTELQTLIIDKLLALPQVAHCRTQLIFGEPLVAPLRHRPSKGASRGSAHQLCHGVTTGSGMRRNAFGCRSARYGRTDITMDSSHGSGRRDDRGH